MDFETALAEPEVRPFLPLLYLAWADGELDDDERARIHARIVDQPWLKPRIRLALERWLDGAPPDAVTLAKVRSALVAMVGTLPDVRRRSVLAIARSLPAVDDASVTALRDLERILGVSAADLGAPADHAVTDAFASAPSFDPLRLRALLDGPFADAREDARAFLADPANRPLYGVGKEEHRTRVYALLADLAKRGFGALAFPGVTCDGTRGLGPFLATFETLAFGDLSLVVKFGVQFGLWGGSVFFLGTDAQKRTFLPDVASLRAPGCFAMSEVGHGSNVADLETVVRWNPETKGFVLHTPRESARKDWAGNAACHAKFATVFAQLEVGSESHGVHAFVVPIRDHAMRPLPGIRIGDAGHKAGLNGVDNGRLWFDHVAIPRDALLGRYAAVDENGTYSSPIASPGKRFFTMLGTLVGGRIAVAASGVSAAKVGLTVALRYATARRQFGVTNEPETLLLEYPSHQRRLLPRLAETYAYHFAVDAVRTAFLSRGPDDDTRELEGDVAGVKALATWHATDTLQACREACGGQGYLSVNRIADARADADIFTTFEGDNTVLLQLLAKGLLTGFRKRFAERGLVRFVAGHLKDTAALTNPFTSRDADEDALRDAATQLAIVDFREASLLRSAASRVRKRLAADVEPTRVFNDVQEHLLALARAHVEAFTLRAFVRAVDASTGGERAVLDRLRTLHGITLLERHTGWFLENGVFEAPRARAVRKLAPRLFAELLPDTVALTSAFGIPDACLAAPIAFSDPAHPRW
ncbi:MAG: acyl-CoA dehydrogenase [Polyangiaceae bacterium]